MACSRDGSDKLAITCWVITRLMAFQAPNSTIAVICGISFEGLGLVKTTKKYMTVRQ
jgi:hypothetical protein